MPSQTFFSPEMRALLVFHFAVRNNTPQFVHDNLFLPWQAELLTIKRLRVWVRILAMTDKQRGEYFDCDPAFK